MIRFDGVDLGYRRSPVLTQIECAIEPGDFIGLAGPNGSGKTTFLRAVLGLLSPLRGTIEVDRRRKFAYVPQLDDLNLLWPLTVEEAVLLPLRGRRLLGRVTPDERRMADEAIDRTGLVSLRAARLSELSGGQRQRTILAAALAQDPDVMVLDEPTRGLDVRAETDLLNLVAGLQRQKRLTVLLVSHTLQIPLNYADKILLFDRGRVHTATPHELTQTDRLERIYGLPFVHGAMGAVRWISPVPGKQS